MTCEHIWFHQYGTTAKRCALCGCDNAHVTYYLDCEFDGHLGELISLALVSPTRRPLYWVSHDFLHGYRFPRDSWVGENVLPFLMDVSESTLEISISQQTSLGGKLRKALDHGRPFRVIADCSIDHAYFTRALHTTSRGAYESFQGDFEMHVKDVDWKSELIGRQHNAFNDASALMRFVEKKGEAL